MCNFLFQIRDFTFQLIQNRLTFTACGFYDLDHTLIYNVSWKCGNSFDFLYFSFYKNFDIFLHFVGDQFHYYLSRYSYANRR